MPNQRGNEPYVYLRQADMMREARRYRLAAQTAPQSTSWFPGRIYRRALAWFGRSLVAAGQRLQQKAGYSRAIEGMVNVNNG